MLNARLALLNVIDSRAKEIAEAFARKQPVTERILSSIIELYVSAKVERAMQDDFFEAAYHAPITGEFEFFIARILYHYSSKKQLEWKILLRRQESKTAPDIRIQKNDRTLVVIEIKAKGGWIQPFLSADRYEHDKKRKLLNNLLYEPDDLVQKQKNQLIKYITAFHLSPNQIYYLLPTLALVHRKRYTATLSDYYDYFSASSSLPRENMILLSSNLRLDLSHKPNMASLQPTDNFERMVQQIAQL